tara:strand:- start:352 stop:642 length:291 start_codon:yes stop_codon:yes gene_type:complete
MKIHPIFSQSYLIWWFVLAAIIGLKIMLFGLKDGGVSNMETYQDSGVIFWIIAILFSSIIFSSPFYVIYRLISRKWNNKIFMIIISILVGMHLVIV